MESPVTLFSCLLAFGKTWGFHMNKVESQDDFYLKKDISSIFKYRNIVFPSMLPRNRFIDTTNYKCI